MMTFSFVNHIVLKARRGHIPYEELPVLIDAAHADHLCNTAFPHLDPSQKSVRRRHFAISLIWTYRA